MVKENWYGHHMIPSPGNISLGMNEINIPTAAKPGLGHFVIKFRSVPETGAGFKSAPIRIRSVGWLRFQDPSFANNCYSWSKMGQTIDPVNDKVMCGESFQFQGVTCIEHSGVNGQIYGSPLADSVCTALGPRPPIYIPCAKTETCKKWAWFAPKIVYGATAQCNVACKPEVTDPDYTTMYNQSLRRVPLACTDLTSGQPYFSWYSHTTTALNALAKQRLWCDTQYLPSHIHTPHLYQGEWTGWLNCNFDKTCDGGYNWEVWQRLGCSNTVCPSVHESDPYAMACIRRVNPRVEVWYYEDIVTTCGFEWQDVEWPTKSRCESFEACPTPINAALHPDLYPQPVVPDQPSVWPEWPAEPAIPPNMYFTDPALRQVEYWQPSDKYPYYDPNTYPVY